MRTWVLAADAGRARVFSAAQHNAGLTEEQDLVNPDARLLSQELTSDAPGRAFDSMGANRHAMEAATDSKVQISMNFARRIVAILEQGLSQNQFDRLLIAAPPRFLGLLRAQLTDRLNAKLLGTVARDLTRDRAESIRRHFDQIW